MLQNAYLDAEIGVDTEENGPSKVWGFKMRFFRQTDANNEHELNQRITIKLNTIHTGIENRLVFKHQNEG